MNLSTQSEDVVCFTIPGLCPPSTNHYTRPCKYIGKDGFLHAGRKVTPEAKAFKNAVAIFARNRTVAPATERERKDVRYRIGIHVVLGPGARMDCDNSSKVALDALQNAGVIHSDAKVVECVLTIERNDRNNSRTEFMVSRID